MASQNSLRCRHISIYGQAERNSVCERALAPFPILVALERQSSITSHSSNAFFDEQEETASLERTTFTEKEGIWNTTRRKLTLVSLCLVYFAATASFAILSPFFPSEVSFVNYFSPKCRLRRVWSGRRVLSRSRITALHSMARGQRIG